MKYIHYFQDMAQLKPQRKKEERVPIWFPLLLCVLFVAIIAFFMWIDIQFKGRTSTSSSSYYYWVQNVTLGHEFNCILIVHKAGDTFMTNVDQCVKVF